jgi:hypothetical protein
MSDDLRDFDAKAADYEVLRKAVSEGIVDHPLKALMGSPVLGAAIQRAEVQFGTAQNTGDLENAGISPKSIHFQHHSYGRFLHPGAGPPYDQWSVELARFQVPSGMVGIVKGFEQYLAQPAQLAFDAISYTSSSRWGIPGPWNTGNAGAVTDTGTWYFRLHSVHQGTPAPVNVTGNFPLPDQAYPDFPRETGLWFPAGSCSGNNIHLVVPAGHLLRLIWVTPVQGVQLEVAAKLKGFIQSDRTPESAYNVRVNW